MMTYHRERHKDDHFSLMTRIFRILVIGFLVFGIALLAEIISISMQLRREVIRQNSEILNMQVNNLDEWLLKEENDLVSWDMSENNVARLKQCADGNEAERIVTRLRTIFVDNMNRRSFCEFYFVLKDVGGKRVSGLAINGNFSALDKSSLERFIADIRPEDIQEDHRWQLMQIGERRYYFYCLRSEGFLMGQAVSLEKIIDYIGMEDGRGKNLGIYVTGQPILIKEPEDDMGKIVSGVLRDDRERKGMIRKNHLVLTKRSSRLGHEIIYIQAEVLTENYLRVLIMLYGSVVFISLVYVLVSWIAFKNLKEPLGIIKKAMVEVKKGRMETQIAQLETMPVEFREIAQVFNDMMEQIRDYKISSYENEIKKKDYEIQYLALQIEPHFYLNAMKGIYALAQKKNYAKVQELILNLSGYFRYLTYNKEHQTALQEEIEHIKCYLNILKLVSSKPVFVELELDGRANNVKVPKLMLQTFIENSFKYASVEDRELRIEIKIDLFGEGEEYLSLSIKDNGDGFPKEVLDHIDGDRAEERNGHVGLNNLYHRLRLLYGDKAYMNLSNIENGGALAEVMIPVCTDKR